MPEIDFDFARYIAERRNAGDARLRARAAYAYPGDQKVLRTLSRVTPVTLAVTATVRLFRNAARSEILDAAVRVTDAQLPELHALTVDCASRLQIALPPLYIAPSGSALDAHTFGTEDDALIVLNRTLVDHLSADELRFVIGHECGHIHNSHAVYITALYHLTHSASQFMRWIVRPAALALESWARRAEITCDRAGLLCCGEVDASLRALVKLALGSRRLVGQVDLDQHLEQLGEGPGPGRPSELVRSHPQLSRRVAALRLFAETHFFHEARGGSERHTEARSLDWCDAEVSRILSAFGGAAPAASGRAARDEPQRPPEE